MKIAIPCQLACTSPSPLGLDSLLNSDCDDSSPGLVDSSRDLVDLTSGFVGWNHIPRFGDAHGTNDNISD